MQLDGDSLLTTISTNTDVVVNLHVMPIYFIPALLISRQSELAYQTDSSIQVFRNSGDVSHYDYSVMQAFRHLLYC